MSFTKPLAAAAVLMAMAVPASALTANATTDLNLRAGPGNMYPIQGVIASSAEVDVQGCIAGSEWCKVTYNGTEGWAYSAYLTSTYESNPVVVYDNMQRLNLQEIDPVNIDRNPAKTFTPSGALILGQPTSVPIVIDDNVAVQYVRANPVEPIYLEGEVVVGAGIPENVTIYPVPDTTYQYVNVNDQLVLVEPGQRRIVQVLR
ncbi:DUF1236 domain-containing protein [Seohaeicola nanhaiensis]|uniref:DUF1236 domain-containing protein n=1 Tax=Seohaeicola nanhaiensis TaxID=1387282 RepID=A0ABV9KJW2_9RHOB